MGKKFKFLLFLIAASSANIMSANDSIPKSEQLPARAYFQDGKLNLESKNQKFKLWFDNRVFVDAAYYMPTHSVDGLQTKANKDLETDDSKFRFSNGLNLRHARLGIKATLYEKWFAELDVDFAYNLVEIKDMYLGYNFNDNWSVKVGQFKEPMSMDRMTSSRYITALERPMPVEAFAPGRRIGAAFTGWGNHWWTSAGVFGRGVDVIQKERNRGNDGLGVTARAAWSPFNSDEFTLHLGGYASYRKPDMTGTENRVVEFRTFPESRVDRRRFIRNEIKNVNHYNVVGLELGVKYDKAIVHGEYLYARVSRVGLKACDFNGWYVTGSYMLLGNQRQYSREDAEFGPMNVTRRGGNLEVAARASYINLNDFHQPDAAVLGGSGYVYTASLNWYPVRNVMVGLNYSYVNNDKYADDKGHITCGGKPLSATLPDGLDFNVLQMRFMVSF